MDILTENLPHLLPSHAPDATDEPVHQEYWSGDTECEDDICDFDPEEFRTCIMSSIAKIYVAFPAWDREIAERILVTTQTICRLVACCGPRDYETLLMGERQYNEGFLFAELRLLKDAVCQITKMRNIFQDTQDYNKYMRSLLRTIKFARKCLEAYDKLDAGIDDFHREWTEVVRPHKGTAETDKSLWAAWSSNTVAVGSDEQRKAIMGKRDFKAMSTYLPRGGCGIVEQWRSDVNEVVESIQQIKRSTEVEAQNATHQTTYLLAVDEGKENLTRMRSVVDQPGGSLFSSIAYDHIAMSGLMLGSLEGFQPQAPAGQPFGMWENTYMTVSRMKEGRNERAELLDGIGREW